MSPWNPFLFFFIFSFPFFIRPALGRHEQSMDIPSLPALLHQQTTTPLLTDILNTLTSLQRRPTCYRKAAISIIHHCKEITTDIPDHNRVRFAIKLTICELDLIAQTPDVCRVEERWRECVRELASKDHWWATFSGNLHEVMNVCWIGRQEVEKGNSHQERLIRRSTIGVAY